MHKRFILATIAAFAVAGCEPNNQATAGENATPPTSEALPGGGAAKPLEVMQIAVATKEEVGEYLADGEGRALYILEGTRQQAGQQSSQTARCTGACLEEWPPFHSQGSPGAGPGVDSAQVGTMAMEGAQHVTYAGWPLYYYEPDRVPGSTSGHGTTDEFGTWRLLSPSGEPLPGGDPGKAPK